MNVPSDALLPPHSIEAEQSLLGGLLLDGRSWDRIGDIISESDFYRDAHRRIFRHIAILSNAGKSIDVVTVFESIERSNEVDQTEGIGYLGELANAVASTADIRHHAEIVRKRAVLRSLLLVGADLQTACFKPGARSAQDIAAEAEAKFAELFDVQADEPTSVAEAFAEAMRYVDARGETGGLATGFRDFDAMTGGLEPGQLVIVAARPSVGKTAFALNIADHVAANDGAALIFSLEMSRLEVAMRLLAAGTGVSVHAMRTGTRDKNSWDRMTEATTRAGKVRLFIDDKPAIGIGYVRARARRMKRKQGLSLIVVDYIGLMASQGDNRTQQLGAISRGLKALAKELEVPIIALAQLNRGIEGRQDKRPMMSDLRDSGEIEQDADIVAMLHREANYSDAPEWAGVAELLVRKNRNGPIGDLMLGWCPRDTRFSDYAGTNPRRQPFVSETKARGRGFAS